MPHRIRKRQFRLRLIAVLVTATFIFLTGCNVSYSVPEVPSVRDNDKTVMTPWNNSNIIGTVGWEVTENYKDDFYYAVNHDWLRDARLESGKTYIANIDEMTEFLLSEENHRLGDIIISPGVDVSPKDSLAYEVTISVPKLLLGDSDEYVNMSANGERQKAYIDGCASYVMSRLGMTEEDQQKTLEQAYGFDKKIAAFEKSSLGKTDPSYVSDSVNIMTFEELSE